MDAGTWPLGTYQVVLERKKQGREVGWQPELPELCLLLSSVPSSASPGPRVLFGKNRLIGERSLGEKLLIWGMRPPPRHCTHLDTMVRI